MREREIKNDLENIRFPENDFERFWFLKNDIEILGTKIKLDLRNQRRIL